MSRDDNIPTSGWTVVTRSAVTRSAGSDTVEKLKYAKIVAIRSAEGLAIHEIVAQLRALSADLRSEKLSSLIRQLRGLAETDDCGIFYKAHSLFPLLHEVIVKLSSERVNTSTYRGRAPQRPRAVE